MIQKYALIALVSFLSVGCASVPMASAERSDAVKSFSPPPSGQAGLYIYRTGGMGAALKKDVWVDDKCVGETAPNVFFYQEVQGDASHKISTESEFSPNDLTVKTDAGKNYFIRQYIKLGVFVGGAGLEVVDEEEAKKAIAELKMAVSGTCSK